MLSVLLADGSGDVLKAFKLGLKDSRVVCVTSNVVAEALELKPDIVFVDVLLEPDNGYEIARKIKSERLLEHTKVVIMWGDFLKLDRNQFLESMADSHLKKPFNAKSLKNLISSLFPVSSFSDKEMSDISSDGGVMNDSDEFSSVPISSLQSLDLGGVSKTKPSSYNGPSLGLNESYSFDNKDRAYTSPAEVPASNKLNTSYDLQGLENGALSRKEQIEILENQTQKMIAKLLPNIVTRYVKEEIKKLMAASKIDE